MSVSRKVASLSSAVPLLPADIVIEVLAVAHWKDVLSARQVSTLWCALSKMRTVWTFLILRETQPTSDRPTLHYLTRPIHAYATAELEETFKQWKISEQVLRGDRKAARDCQRMLSFPKATPGTPGAKIKYSVLLPGGRWFILFDDGPNARAFDLNAEHLVPHVLLAQERGPSFRWVGRPCVQSDVTAPDKFLIALPLCDHHDMSAPPTWTVQILLLETIRNHDGGPEVLRATIRTSLSLALQLPLLASLMPHDESWVAALSLTSNTIALRILVALHDGFIITLVKWSDLPQSDNVHFPRTTMKYGHDCLKLILAPNDPNLLIIIGRDRAYVLDFSILPVQTSFDAPPTSLSHTPFYFPAPGGLRTLCSEPFFLHPAPGHLRIRILAPTQSTTSMLLAMQFDVVQLARRIGDREVSASYSMLTLPTRCDLSKISGPLRYNYAIAHSAMEDRCFVHHIHDIWTSVTTAMPEIKASTKEPTFSIKGQVLQIDEGTGRCVALKSFLSGERERYSITVTDIAL